MASMWLTNFRDFISVTKVNLDIPGDVKHLVGGMD